MGPPQDGQARLRTDEPSSGWTGPPRDSVRARIRRCTWGGGGASCSAAPAPPRTCSAPANRRGGAQVQGFGFCARGSFWTYAPSPRQEGGPASGFRGYRGTAPARKRTPLGPYCRPMPRVLEGSQGGGGRFLVIEVSVEGQGLRFMACRVHRPASGHPPLPARDTGIVSRGIILGFYDNWRMTRGRARLIGG